MNETKLILILEVDYDLNGESVDALRANLKQIVKDAMGRGGFTGDGPAEVYEWRVTIGEVTGCAGGVADLTRWLSTLSDGTTVYIDDGGINLCSTEDPDAYWELGGHTPDGDEDAIDFDQWDADEYDVEGMKFDHEHGNFNPDNAERYRFTNQIEASFVNGQFKQAKQICEACGLNYELERFKFDGYDPYA